MFICGSKNTRIERDSTVPSCELCGRNMKGHGRNVTIEGATMNVCPQCAGKFGGQSSTSSGRPTYDKPSRPSWTGGPDPRSTPTPSRPRNIPRAPAPSRPKPRPTGSGPLLDDMDLIEDYSLVIRSARQKKKMSQEELAQKVGERVATLQSIESGRLKPTRKAIRGLERELGISLLEPMGTVPLKTSRGTGEGGPTLGDIVKVKRKKSQKSEE
ncbi:MAG: multiprotein bridging factor aMBF1 [Candidatus Thorarchaeota archaeon]|nr:multiprotein bridging factor aMBF1 [Candidatus Thorarchaeota archaeon]